VKAVCIDVEMICCYRILSLSLFSLFDSFVGRERCFFFLLFFLCVWFFFFLFCFSLHSITICPYAMVYLGHGFFFLLCTDGFFLGLCAWKCRAVPDSARLNGKVLMDGSTLKPKSGIRLLIFFFVVSVTLSYEISKHIDRCGNINRLFVCFGQRLPEESRSRVLTMVCCFSAFVRGQVDIWRQLHPFTYLGE